MISENSHALAVRLALIVGMCRAVQKQLARSPLRLSVVVETQISVSACAIQNAQPGLQENSEAKSSHEIHNSCSSGQLSLTSPSIRHAARLGALVMSARSRGKGQPRM